MEKIETLAHVREAAEKLIADRAVPGLVILVQKGNQAPDSICLGVDGGGQPLTEDILFPVASLSKLATALTVLRLVAQHRLALDDPLANFLPEATAAKSAQNPVTIRALLCHMGGLPEDLAEGAAPYAVGLSWPLIAAACLKSLPDRPAWTKLIYSNPGYALLAMVVEHITASPFPQALRELVLAPLAIEATLGEEPARTPAKISGDFGAHAGTELEPFNTPFSRSLALPYGSLVTTARGSLSLVRVFAGDPQGFLPAELLAEARRDQTRGLPGSMAGLFEWEQAPWGLGVELRGVKSPHAIAPQASPASFGHVGASGSSAWFDPARDLAWVALGPRLFTEWWQEMPAISAAVLAA